MSGGTTFQLSIAISARFPTIGMMVSTGARNALITEIGAKALEWTSALCVWTGIA